jgi:chemotaxis protein CheD
MSSIPSIKKRINVTQGEYAISDKPGEVITTILGSCVAVCLFDPIGKVGGMNHFLLPGDSRGSGADVASYGLNSMELLINGLLKVGAKRNRFEAKIFGGAKMIEGLSDVGMKNAHFATEFLSFEGIPCVSKSLGGINGRRLRFWPTTGHVQMLLLGEAAKVAPIIKPKPAPVITDDVELF